MPDGRKRTLPRAEAKSLPTGAEHYSAYVGPATLYDVMGASQFRLLTTLGLRETHYLLDFGCGSLRLGRFLLPYLLPGRYHGVEPNNWLVEDAIASEIGADQIKIKQPRFQNNDDFTVDGFGVQFDFIIAQSIFSHCGAELVDRALRNFVGNLSETGLILATFVHVGSMGLNQEFSGNGWVYPGCVAYHPDTILAAIRRSNLHGVRLPWFHPSQQWYAMAKSPSALPLLAKFSHLSGAVLRQPEFASSS